jgi:putative membrane protein
VTNTEKKARSNPSRVRDHLANERTYLAWMRSAIALMGFGVVIVRLRQFHIPQIHRPGLGWKLGLLFSIVGLLTVFLSTLYYFAIRYAIDEDTYEPSTRRVIAFSITISLLGAAVIYFVFSTALDPMSSFVPD